MKKLLLLIAVLLACGQADEVDIGQVEQPFGSCLMGVNVAAANFANTNCNPASSSHSCRYYNNYTLPNWGIFPINVSLGSGWSAAERSTLQAAANQASIYIDNELTCWYPPQQPTPPMKWNVSTSNVAATVKLNKGSISGTPPINNTYTLYTDFMRLSCTSQQQLTENYPAVLGTCKNWTGTVDYNDVLAWANSGGWCGDSSMIMRNLFQKALIIGGGMGMNLNAASGTVTSVQVDRGKNPTNCLSVAQTGWNYFPSSPNNSERDLMCQWKNAATAATPYTCL